jgi:DNA-directed RNA polymerase II subunit RPB2
MKPVWCGNSRYAQKGTIGAVVPEVDMPWFPRNGTCPDILINPACIPSRMTNGKILEIVASKAALIKGQRVNATAFRPFQIETFQNTLKDNGYSPNGLEMICSGTIGAPLPTPVFTGPCYYQVLKHYVKHKMQVRSRGVKNALTQQPIPGRARGGAIKFEEMTRDACVSHGATNVLKEKFEHSDASKQIICINCKYLSNVANINRPCPKCIQTPNVENTQNYAIVNMPYSAKLLINQLTAAGIQLITKTKPLQTPNTDFLTKK